MNAPLFLLAGRAGKSGVATTLLTPEDTHIYYDLTIKLQVPLPSEYGTHQAVKARF